ncbi:MAG: InlB B-repeat-containing protein, partial [Micrococcales bacterium]
KAASTGVPAMTSAELSLAFVKSAQVATKPQNLKVFSNPESITVNFEAPANALQSLTGGYQYSTDAGRTWLDQDITLLPDNKTIEMVITDEAGGDPLDATKTYLLRIRAISLIEDAAPGEPTTSTQAYLGHSVAFDANGGSGTMPNLNVPLDSQKLLPASTFVLANNRVIGWSSTADGQVEFLNRSLFDGSFDKLYAIWTVAKYTVTFDTQGGQSQASLSWFTNSGSGLSLPVGVKLGYNFVGWATSADATADSVIDGLFVPTSDTTLFALWEVNNNVVLVARPTVLAGTKVPLSYTGGFGTKVATYRLITDESDETCVLALSPVTVTSSTDAGCVVEVTIAANGSVPAMTSDQVTVSFSTDVPSPMAPVITRVASLPSSIEIYFTPPANAADSKVVSYKYTTDETGETWLAATAVGNKLTITKDSVTNSALDRAVLYQISILAVSSVGAAEGDPSDSAQASLGYQVTFDPNGGVGAMDAENMPLDESLAATLSTNTFARAGYQFVGWSKDKRDTIEDDIIGDEEVFVPTANTKLYAIWQQTTYVVSLDAKGGFVDTNKFYFDSLGESPVELPSAERPAYDFLGWFAKDAEGTEYQITEALYPEDNMTVYAKWQLVNSFMLDFSSFESAADRQITVTLLGAFGTGRVTYTSTSSCAVSESKTGVVTIAAKLPGFCTVSAKKLAGTLKVGNTTFDIPQMLTENYEIEFTAIEQAPLLITNRVKTNAANLEIALTSSGGSGTGAVTYDTDTENCKVVFKAKKWLVSTTVAQTCNVVAYKDQSGIYFDAQSEITPFVFSALTQTKLVIANRALSAPVFETMLVSTTGGTGAGAVSYSVTGAGCVLNGASLTSQVIATCSVTATKAAAGWYASTTSAAVVFRFMGLPQSAVTITNTALSWSGLDSVGLYADGGSGTGGYFFTSATSGCEVSEEGILSVTKPANCVVLAFREGDTIYATSSASASKTFVFAAVAQDTVTMTNSSFDYPGDQTVTLTAEGGTGTGTAVYTYATSSANCVIAADKLTITRPGSCIVSAKRTATGVYALSSASATQTFNFAAVDQQAITTSTKPTNTAVDKVKLVGTGGNGTGAFTYSIATVNPSCVLVGDLLTVTAVTTCDITIKRAASGVYNERTSDPITFTFTLAPQATVKITNGAKEFNKIAGQSLLLKASGGTGTGAIEFTTTTTGCLIVGATVSVDRPANCVVTAKRLASGVYRDSDASISKTVIFAGLVQAATVTLTTAAQTVAADQSISLAATSSTGNTDIYYRATTPNCVVTDNVLTVTAFGKCTVSAYLRGTGLYADKASAAKVYTFAALAQAAVTLDNPVVKQNILTQLTAAGGTGTSNFSYTVSGTGGCSITSQGVLKGTKIGTCTVVATKAANGLYDKKSVTRTYSVTR